MKSVSTHASARPPAPLRTSPFSPFPLPHPLPQYRYGPERLFLGSKIQAHHSSIRCCSTGTFSIDSTSSPKKHLSWSDTYVQEDRGRSCEWCIIHLDVFLWYGRARTLPTRWLADARAAWRLRAFQLLRRTGPCQGQRRSQIWAREPWFVSARFGNIS